MFAAPLKLEYELSRADARVWFERERPRMRPSWVRRIGVCLVLWFLIDSWNHHSWWSAVLLLLIALKMWTFPMCLYWLGWVLMKVLPARAIPLQLETDDRGLLLQHAAKKHRERFWWSRLSGIEESDLGIGLQFDKEDWSRVLIPWKAFPTDERRRAFLDLVQLHLQGTLQGEQ